MIKCFSTLFIIAAFTCVIATNSPTLAQNSGSSSTVYESGQYSCWGVMVSRKGVCNVMIIAIAKTLGCRPGRGNSFRQRLSASKCAIKRVKGANAGAFRTYVINFHRIHRATIATALARNSGPTLYKPGTFVCFGVWVSDRKTCDRLIVDVGKNLGCPISKEPIGRQRVSAEFCIEDRSNLRYRRSQKSMAAFQAIFVNYYKTHNIAIKTKVARLPNTPTGKYRLGSYNCFGIGFSGKEECTRLFFDLARHLKCPRNIAKNCIKRKSGISSRGSRRNTIAFNEVIRDFYKNSRNTKNGKIAASNELTEFQLPLDGHHRSKGYSNIHKSRSVCPTSGRIEININVDDGKRRWTSEEIFQIVAHPYEIIRIEGNGANRCLEKPIQFVVKLDGNKVYSAKYDKYRENKRVFMGKMGQSVMAKIIAIYTPGSSVRKTSPNPYRDIGKLERDYSKTSMVSIYDGKFSEIIYPLNGKRNQQLAVLVFNFFGGVRQQSASAKCYPTGSVKFPWIQVYETKDSYGNIINRSEKKIIELIAPEVKPLYQKYSASLITSNASAYRGAIHLIAAFGCDSHEYQSMFKQILILSSGILTGFDSVQSTNGLKISRNQRIKFVRNCLSHDYELTAIAYQKCVCVSQISEKYYRDASKYISSGYRWGASDIKDSAAFSLEFRRECLNRVGNHRPEISRLIKDLVSDIK